MLSPNKIFSLLKSKNSSYWEKLQHENSLKLFQQAAENIPAYKDFLKKNRISPDKIKSFQDFQLVPPINKKNYLSQYKLADLAWKGKLNDTLIYTSTSGTSGIPFFFMRKEALDWQYSIIVEQFLKNSTLNLEKPTLVIICFGMGIWIGGLITYKAFEIVGLRNNLPLSIITPGINKGEIMNILRLLAPQYEQILFVGYPPFIKDIIDEAKNEGINLKKYQPKILFAAESITEPFRDYLVKQAGVKNIYTDIINIYGSADIGAMAFESSISTLIRRLTLKNRRIFETVFSPINKTPTLAQYNPLFINFEAVNGEILLTGDSAIPLVRYAIGDKGGAFTYDQIEKRLLSAGIDLKKQLSYTRLSKSVSKLPFVYLYERIDLSATFYGMWIYPEWFKSALLAWPIRKYLTGKFTIITKFDKNQNQFLEINLELKKGMSAKKINKKLIRDGLIESLRKNSSEYRELSDKLKTKAWPRLKYWSYESNIYFRPGIKQKWVKK